MLNIFSNATSSGPFALGTNPVPAIGNRAPITTPITAAARSIGKYFEIGSEKRWILRNVDFSVVQGECVFLSGPSGSGKSTLLSILGCLLTPDEGNVFIQEQQVSCLDAVSQARVRRDLIGFVFQRFQLIRGMNAEENVALPLGLRGVPTLEAIRRAGEWLGKVGLAEHRRSMPSRMSPGQCQRVALARALIGGPRLVLADEPTAALDRKSGADVMKLMKELIRETGASAVVVTHDPRIHEYADRICEMENGVIRETLGESVAVR